MITSSLTPLKNNRTSIDISVDFLSWVNSEMRKIAHDPEEFNDETAKNVGLVNRLRAYVAARIAPTN
jgi:hypothetical protein